jgi:hypothetical protein
MGNVCKCVATETLQVTLSSHICFYIIICLEMQKVNTWQIQSMDRQSMLDKIEEIVMWISKYLMCFDCMAKEWRVYPWTTKWYSWCCIGCWLEWEDIWLNRTTKKYKWDCMIWDVLEYIYSDNYKNYISTYNDKDDLMYFNWWVGVHVMTLMKLWHSLNKSIGIQNMDCIQYVYELTLQSE